MGMKLWNWIRCGKVGGVFRCIDCLEKTVSQNKEFKTILVRAQMEVKGKLEKAIVL